MARLGAIFVGVCMMLIAGSLGAVLYLYFGMSGAESAIVALAGFTGLAVYNSVSGRLRDRDDVGTHIADLSRGTADLARQVLDLGRRVAAVEARTEGAVDRAAAATQPLAAEIGELGGLIKQLAESIAAHDEALRALGSAVPPVRIAMPAAPAPPVQPAASAVAAPAALLLSPAGTQPASDSAKGADRAELGEPEAAAAPPPTGRFKGMERDAVVAVIRQAVQAEQVELYLQPIVTLPQRKVRFYEAMTRLRTREGELLLPADFLPFAESGGLMPKIDNLMLFRCVQTLRRLLAKNREIGLFCNVSATSLIDAEFFPQFTEFMDANRALASALVFEFTQPAFRTMGPIENESLGALADRGFRFSIDHVADLRFEPRHLAERGFRFIKVPASILLNRNAATATDIHPADLSGLLSRFGIELIAEKIESEATVVDLLDYDVKFGQGFLFSPPRPVRPEVLQAARERGDAVARDLTRAEPPRPAAPAVPAAQAEPGRAPETVGSAEAPRSTGPARPSAAERQTVLAQIARGLVARN